MNIRTLITLVCLLLNSLVILGQTRKEVKSEIKKLREMKFPIQQFNSYSVADSLINNLTETQTDTILLFYQSSYSRMKDNADGTNDYKVSTIIWKKNDSLFIQKVNNYAIYEPISTWRGSTDLYFLFRFFIENEELLKKEEIQSTKRRSYLSLVENLHELTQSNEQVTIIKFHVGGQTTSWNFPGIGMGDYLDNDKFMEDLNKKLYLLAILLEHVNRENLTGRQWNPKNLKYMPDEEYQKKLDEYEEKLLKRKNKD